MHDPALVRVLERFADLLCNPQRFIDRNRTGPDAIRQRWPFDQFHHQRMSAAGIFEAVDRSDVGMVQRGEDFGFALEPRHALGVARECFGQDFQCHIAPELRIPRAVHLAHPARTNSSENFIGT